MGHTSITSRPTDEEGSTVKFNGCRLETSHEDSLKENKVWTLANLPKGKNAVGSKWVFKTKTGKDGEVTRYKARLVARGLKIFPNPRMRLRRDI